jgi:hypothetical protein
MLNEGETMIRLTLLILVLIINPAYSIGTATSEMCEIDSTQIQNIFENFKTESRKLRVIKQKHAKNVKETWALCKSAGVKALCNRNIPDADKKTLVNFIAQMDNKDVQEELLKKVLSVDPRNLHYKNLMGYLKQIEDKCSPPKFDMCSPERYHAVFSEYFKRISIDAPHLARHAESGENFYKNIPGLAAEADVVNGQTLRMMDNADYVSSLGREFPQGSTSIILNQARKKSLNEVSKGVSDLIGNKGNEFYFERLNEALKRNGIPEIGDGVYVDYKEAALILDNSKIGDPAKFQQIAEQAARDADRDLRNYVENNFPETLYLMDDADRGASWINTSVFRSGNAYSGYS